MLTSLSAKGRGRSARGGLIVVLLGLAAMWPGFANAQHTSTECPAQTASVTAGGSVTINISDCEAVSGLGGDGAIDGGSYGPSDTEDHGTATTRHTGGQWYLDYSNNGTGVGSTDVFELSDGSLTGAGDIRFTINAEGAANQLTWTMDGPNTFMGKVFSVFVNMDKMIGKDFEAGLAALKQVAERK